jgi:hypothetical protein
MRELGSERIDALRRWSRLLDAARAGDIPQILRALPEADLVGMLDVADAPVSLAVCEYVLAHGSTAAVIALARRVVLGECDEGALVLHPGRRHPRWLRWVAPLRKPQARPTPLLGRILLRRDPEVDAAFFDLDDTLGAVRSARLAILSDSRGSGRRASIPPEVKKRLLDAVAEHAAHATDGGAPRLLSDLATADDPDLVLAALPYQRYLDAYRKAGAVATLIRHGRRKDLMKLYPKLWKQVSREARRMARSPRRSGWEYKGPARPAVMSRDHYIKETETTEYREYPRLLRQYAMESLRTGTIVADDVVAHSRPAVVALSLTYCTGRDERLPGARRAADDMRTLISERLTAAAGEDPERWAALIGRAAGFHGTFPELLGGLDGGFPPQSYPYDDRSAHDPWNATTMLFAMAPHDVAKHVLEDDPRNCDRLQDHLAASAPLTRYLVERVIRDGTAGQREALAGNDATPDSVLTRLLEHKELAGVIARRRFVAPEIRLAALNRYGFDKTRGIADHPIREVMKLGNEAFLSTLKAATDPEQLVTIVDAATFSLAPEVRMAAYSILAEAAGPEAVWALELNRAGSLEEMEPQVRASMAAGTAEALHSVLSVQDPGQQPWRADARLDEPFAHSLEALTRAHLDGHPERWPALVDLMAARPDATFEDLVVHLSAR